jgi:hypothetical protein
MRRTLPLLALALAVLSGSCADDSGSPTTGPRPTTDITVDVGGGSIEETIESLIEVTETLRGLEFIEPPRVTLLSQEELGARVAAEIDEEVDPAEIAVEEAWYVLLGILDPEIDLLQALKDLYAEQVAGLYDPDTGELLVSNAGELTPLAQTIVVHELVHALTDQHFEFNDVFQELIDAERYHEASALQALVEGDATYFQLVYLQELPSDQRVAAVAESLEADTTVIDSLPDWFGEDLTFPYDSGFAFVTRLVEERGLQGLDQAYQLVPTSTEQVMHPEKYFILEPPRESSLPDTPLEGYEVFEEGSIGEWNLRLYLLDGVDDGEALVAAAGWGGDAYRLMWDGERVAFIYRFEGDTPRDAEELAESLVSSIGGRMSVGSSATSNGVTTFVPGGDFAFVTVHGSTVWFVAADDPVAGQTLADLVPEPVPDQ